jgi:hypothetical protein
MSFRNIKKNRRIARATNYDTLETVRNWAIAIGVLVVSGIVIKKYLDYKWGEYKIQRGIEKAEQRTAKQEEAIFKAMEKREGIKAKFKA